MSMFTREKSSCIKGDYVCKSEKPMNAKRFRLFILKGKYQEMLP